MPQEPFLACEAARIARHAAISADDAVAWHNNGDGVLAIGGADSTGQVDVAESAGEIAIGARGADRDLFEQRPDLVLECRAATVGFEPVDGLNVAREIAVHDRGEAKGVVMGRQRNVAVTRPHVAHVALLGVVKLKQQQHAIMRNDHHVADGCCEFVGEEERHGRHDTKLHLDLM